MSKQNALDTLVLASESMNKIATGSTPLSDVLPDAMRIAEAIDYAIGEIEDIVEAAQDINQEKA